MELSTDLQQLAAECGQVLEQLEAARSVEKKAKKAVEKTNGDSKAQGKNRKLEKLRDAEALLRLAERTARLEQAQAALDDAKKATEAARVKADAIFRKLVDAQKSRLVASS